MFRGGKRIEYQRKARQAGQITDEQEQQEIYGGDSKLGAFGFVRDKALAFAQTSDRIRI